MKFKLMILISITFINSYSQNLEKLEWQNGFGLTHNIYKDSISFKPVQFYLEDPNCSFIAKEFYYGNYRPVDEYKTEKLLHLVLTDDQKLRPFYRWILDKTIIIQDGALGEYTGKPARRYAESYPREFFEFMDSDETNERLSNWSNSILYSGYYENDDSRNPKKIHDELIKTMIENCSNCDDSVKKRIAVFAKNCFPQH